MFNANFFVLLHSKIKAINNYVWNKKGLNSKQFQNKLFHQGQLNYFLFSPGLKYFIAILQVTIRKYEQIILLFKRNKVPHFFKIYKNCGPDIRSTRLHSKRQWLLDIRHIDIRRFSFTSIRNCYSNFDIRHQNRHISRYKWRISNFGSIYVNFYISSNLNGITRIGYRGLPVLIKSTFLQKETSLLIANLTWPDTNKIAGHIIKIAFEVYNTCTEIRWTG